MQNADIWNIWLESHGEHQINVKEETEEKTEENGQAKDGSGQCLSKHSEETGKESGHDQSSNAAEGQFTELESQVAKRRRLTRKTMQIEASSPEKKEVTVKVKKERYDGQEVNTGSSEKKNLEMNDVYQRLRKEIHKQSTVQSAASSARPATASQQMQLEQRPCDMAEGAQETPPPPEGPKPSKFLRSNVAKQSGVPNIGWSSDIAWQVNFPTFDTAGKKTGRKWRTFAVKKFMAPGMSEAEADAAALQAAKNFRAELVKQGILSEPKPKDPNFTSEVPGVSWNKSEQKWQAWITLKPKADGRKNNLLGGRFTDKAAAEAKALELQQQHGLERQVKAVSSLTELPVFQPKVPHPGVTWCQAEQQWRAQCRVGGVNRNFRVKPKDHSEEEVQRSFQVAVVWKKKQEKERETAAKAKAKPGKKQRK